MPSLEPKAGDRYLTATGAPVQVLEVHDGAMLLQGLASDNRLCVSTAYPLQKFDQNKAAWEMRASLYRPRSKKERRPRPAKALAPLIDAMLLTGGMTMVGIMRELRRKATTACHGKDLKANVRARLYLLRRQGKSAAIRGWAS